MKLRYACCLMLTLILMACSDNASSPVPEQALSAEQRSLAPIGGLDGSAYPLGYQLDIQIDPRQDEFSASMVLNMQLESSATGVWLHGQGLRVSQLILKTEDGQETAATYEEVLTSGVSWVDFGREVPAGEVSLGVIYSADFDNNLAGLFKVEEQGDFYALAKSESIQARKYLLGFDQPGFKAPFSITMTIPTGYQAIGNAPQVAREVVDAEYDRVKFATTPPMSTYLLSLAVGPFDVVERPSIAASEFRPYAIPLRGIARRGRGQDLNYVLDITPRYIEIFEQALGRPYPFKKLDIVAAPAWPSGATELSGAITYREERLFLDADAPPGVRLSLLGIHAHELAHMWFGNQVTPPWWDDLWLKEGFATWATPMVLELFEPDGQHDLNGLVRNFNVMSSDSLASTRAIREPIARNEDIRNAYDGITYSKSQAIIHMVDSYFGAQKFRRALGGYLKAFADKTADSATFYESIGKQTGEPQVTQVFQDFVEKKGVPELNITVNCTTGSARLAIEQQRYSPIGSSIQTNQQWSLPFCVHYAQNGNIQKQCTILDTPDTVLGLLADECPDWIMPNANGSGYYRWRLDSTWQQKLLDHFGTLLVSEQLAIVDSSIAAFEAGHLSMQELLIVVQLSAESGSRQVVEAPMGALQRYLEQVLTSEMAQSFEQQLLPLYVEALDQVMLGEREEQVLLRTRLFEFLALVLHHQPSRAMLADSAAQFTGYKQPRVEGALASDLYVPALSVAVQDLDVGFFEHLTTIVKTMDDPLFLGAVPVALGSYTDASLNSQAYAYVLSDELGARESFDMTMSMLGSVERQADHWQWFKQNLPMILEKIPSQWQRRTPRGAAKLCDADKVSELTALFERYGDKAPGHELALQQSRESLALCSSLRAHLRSL